MPKRISIALAAVLLAVFLAGPAQAGMYVDHVDGLYNTDTVLANTPITFHIGMFVDASGNVTGSTNGFRIYSPSGATWSSSVGTLTGAITPAMMEQFFVNAFSDDGAGADTLGFGGFRLFAPGIPVGFDEIVWTIDIGPISSDYQCGSICLDSSWYPPAGLWKWSTTAGDFYPDWDGPHCYTIFDPELGPCGSENTPPVLDPIGDKIVDENSLLSFTVHASDADADPITLTALTLPTGASFNDNGDGTGDFTWTPDYDQAGTYGVTFWASDGTDSVSEAISINVNNVNRPPVLAAIGNQTTDENVNLNFGLSATDPDGDPLAFNISATDLPAGYSFTDHGDGTATFDWTPTFTDAGSYSVTFVVEDIFADADSEMITIDVNNVNRAPIISSVPDAEVLVDVAYHATIVATDPDGDPVTMYPADVIPPGAAFIDNGNGTADFDWTPTLADIGTWPQAIVADDGAATDTVYFVITVIGPNNAPQIEPIANQEMTECDTLTVPVSASDVDEDPLSLWAEVLVTNMSFVDNGDGTGEFKFTPSFAQAGTYIVTVYATDGIDTASTSFDISVADCTPGEFSADVALDPDTVFAVWAYAVDPKSGTIYFGNYSDSHVPADVDAGSLMINGSLPPTGTSIVNDVPGFTGDVLAVEYPQDMFILGYGPLFDYSTQQFSLSGNFSDGVNFAVNGEFTFRGHASGDFNLDGVADITDLTLLVSYFFEQGRGPRLEYVVDMNQSGHMDVTDITLLVDFLFGK